jgi:hypothetical protein
MFGVLRTLTMLALTALGLWLSYHVWVALRTGAANVHNDVVHRKTRPWYFWTAVAVQAGFAAVCFVSLARALLR